MATTNLTLAPGQTATVQDVLVDYSDGTQKPDVDTLAYAGSDDAVATVDPVTGAVRAVAAGSIVVTVTDTLLNVVGTVDVTVEAPAAFPVDLTVDYAPASTPAEAPAPSGLGDAPDSP